MGTTHKASRLTKAFHGKSRETVQKRSTHTLSPAEAARLAAFDAVVKMRDEQWAAMTPQEKAEDLAAWEQVKKSINEDRNGYREVFVNE